MLTPTSTLEEIIKERECHPRYARKLRALLKAGKPLPGKVRGYKAYGDPGRAKELVELYRLGEISLADAARGITKKGVSVRTFQRRVEKHALEVAGRSIETAAE